MADAKFRFDKWYKGHLSRLSLIRLQSKSLTPKSSILSLAVPFLYLHLSHSASSNRNINSKLNTAISKPKEFLLADFDWNLKSQVSIYQLTDVSRLALSLLRCTFLQEIVTTWRSLTSIRCRDFQHPSRSARSAVHGTGTSSAFNAWTARFSSTSRRHPPSLWFSGIGCCQSRSSIFRGTTSLSRRAPRGSSNATGRLFYRSE